MRATYAVLAPLAETFWSKVAQGDPSDCWLWIGGTSGRGYGQFHLTPRRTGWERTVTVGAHRVAWMLANRRNLPPRDSGLVVDHLCNRPRCCNPAHLDLTTSTANIIRGIRLAPSGRTPERLPSGRYKVRFRRWVEGRRLQSSQTFNSEAEAVAFVQSLTRENA